MRLKWSRRQNAFVSDKMISEMSRLIDVRVCDFKLFNCYQTWHITDKNTIKEPSLCWRLSVFFLHLLLKGHKIISHPCLLSFQIRLYITIRRCREGVIKTEREKAIVWNEDKNPHHSLTINTLSITLICSKLKASSRSYTASGRRTVDKPKRKLV